MDVPVDDKTRLHDALKKFSEAQNELSGLHGLIYKDQRFYLGDQWDAADIAMAEKRKIPVLTLNRIAKMVNVVYGSILQNKLEPKVYPIEMDDDMFCEVLGRTLKWVISQAKFHTRWDYSAKDMCIGGIGWIAISLDYDRDPVNGDIEFTHYAPYDVLFDPDTKMFDMSDCGHIFIHQLVKKAKLAALYPKKAKEIKDMKGGKVTHSQYRPTPGEDSISVVEYWYRDYENVSFMVENEMVVKFEGDDTEKKILEERGVEFVDRMVPSIKLMVYANESVILYDGPSPLGIARYPIIPLLGFYSPSHDKWAERLQGMVRILVDIQKEHNKRRSTLMQAILKMPSSGFAYEEGSLKDESVLDEMGGRGGVKLKVRQGRKFPEPLPSQQIPHAVLLLENLLKDDMSGVSLSPDLLGSLLEKGASGVTVQLRQRQAVMAFQELYSGIPVAMREVGLVILETIIRHFSPEKIMRILGKDYPLREQIEMLVQQREQLKGQVAQMIGDAADNQPMESDAMTDKLIQNEEIRRQLEATFKDIEDNIQLLQIKDMEFWDKYEKSKESLRFDVTIDDQVSSPTYRQAALSQLQPAIQNGMVPIDAIIELLDIPATVKERISAYNQQQQMAQAQAAQVEMQERAARTKAMAGNVDNGGQM